MNIEYLKFALEIAKTKSMNKAAENLYISQPNLSRAIKKLEEEVGVTIFKRTAQGVDVTLSGEELLKHAEVVIDEIEAIKNSFVPKVKEEKFSISVPKAIYISRAFTNFIKQVHYKDEISIDYKESSSIGAIKNILENNFNLGIVRYSEEFSHFFKLFFEETNLIERKLNEFTYYVAFSKNSPLAKIENLQASDFANYIELTHGDSYLPYLNNAGFTEEIVHIKKRIRIYDSMGQLNMLKDIPDTFMVVYPLNYETLDKYDLVQRKVEGFSKQCYDVLVSKKNYSFSDLDLIFINELEKALNNE